MAKMKLHAEDMAEKYLQRHPDKTWEEAMEYVCSRYDITELDEDQNEVYDPNSVTRRN